MTSPDVLVLHQVFHRSEPAEVAAAIRDRLPDASVAVSGSYSESLELIRDARVVVAAFLPGELLDAASALEWVQAVSAGVDHLPTDRLAEENVALTTAAGVHAEPIAEQVLGYMLAFERGLLTAARQQERHEFRHFEGGELRGKSLGVVGLGAIGTRVAELGSALGMTVLGTKRDPSDAPDAAEEVYGPADTDRILGRAHYVVVACPLTPETEHLIDRRAFATMRTDAVLVNIARGGVVDESALVLALQRGLIDGAALDVFEDEPLPGDSPLWNLSNVLVTPHMAGSTPHYWERLADIFARNYEAFAAGRPDEMETRVG